MNRSLCYPLSVTRRAPRSLRNRFSVLGVFLVGAPIFYMLLGAIEDGEKRRHEAPLRAVLGDEVVNSTLRHERLRENYVGNDRRVPDVTLQTRRGPIRLRDLRGKVVVLNFWTVTCGPCLEEMPSLIELAARARASGDVELIAVSTDRDWQTVNGVVGENSPLQVALDANHEIVRSRFGTRLFPETWIIDGNGVVRVRVDGARDWSTPVAWDLIRSYL